MKIVINKCYGGFGLSNKAIEHYAKLKNIELENRPAKYPFSKDDVDRYFKGTEDSFSEYNIDRDDPALAQTVEDLGEEASDFCSDLEVIEIPDGTDWVIEEYDGKEWVAERHKTWG